MEQHHIAEPVVGRQPPPRKGNPVPPRPRRLDVIERAAVMRAYGDRQAAEFARTVAERYPRRVRFGRPANIEEILVRLGRLDRLLRKTDSRDVAPVREDLTAEKAGEDRQQFGCRRQTIEWREGDEPPIELPILVRVRKRP